MEIILLIYVAAIIVGSLIDGARGFLLSLLMGWIGVIISLVMRSGDKRRRQEHLETLAVLSGRSRSDV